MGPSHSSPTCGRDALSSSAPRHFHTFLNGPFAKNLAAFRGHKRGRKRQRGGWSAGPINGSWK